MTAVFVPESSRRFVPTPPADGSAPDAPHGSAASAAPEAPPRARTGATTPGVDAAGSAPGDPPAVPSRARRTTSFRPATTAPAPVGDAATAPAPVADPAPTAPVGDATAAPAPVGDPAPTAPVAEPDRPAAEGVVASVEGYVLFQVRGTTFAVAVGDVREVVRAPRLDLLPVPAGVAYGFAVSVVDARGRAIPVVDLRTDREGTGDVLLPVWRHQTGLVVDRVLSVRTPRELVPEQDEVPDTLPSYARGVLRPADGGDPVLLVALPDAAELERDAARTDEPRLGDDVLAVTGAVVDPDADDAVPAAEEADPGDDVGTG